MFSLKKNISIFKLLLFFISVFFLLIVIPNYYVDVYFLKVLSKSPPNGLFNLLFDNTEYEHTSSPFLIVLLNSLEYKITVLVILIIIILFTSFILIKKGTFKKTTLINKVFKLCLLLFFYYLIYVSYDILLITDNFTNFENLLKDLNEYFIDYIPQQFS